VDDKIEYFEYLIAFEAMSDMFSDGHMESQFFSRWFANLPQVIRRIAQVNNSLGIADSIIELYFDVLLIVDWLEIRSLYDKGLLCSPL
jgi:hypothetical protein